MKHFYAFMKKAAALFFSALLMCGSYKAVSDKINITALNTARISEEQLALCREKELDCFEAEETVRTPLSGAAIYTGGAEAFSPFEGASMLLLSGEGEAGAELSFLKHPSVSESRSIAVCVFIKQSETAASYTLTVDAIFSNTEIKGSDTVVPGSWQTAYLPITAYKPGQLVSVKITVVSSDGSPVEAALDCLHTAIVAGMPEDLPFFASDFAPAKGSVSYSDGGLTFTVNGQNPFLESSPCNYVIPERFNSLAVTIYNGAKAKSAELSCKMNGASKYNESDVYKLDLEEGEATYYFKAGNYRGQSVLNAFRLTFDGRLKGEIKISGIKLTSYRFPAVYPGKLSADLSGDILKITGSVPSYPSGAKEIRLYRLLPGQDEERFEELEAAPYRTAKPSKTFSFDVPKTENGTDNTLYKYFAVFYGESAFYPAAAAYVLQSADAPAKTGTRCVSFQPDVSALAEAEPDTVFFTVDTERIYKEDKGYDEEYFAPFDEAAARLYGEGVSAAFYLSYPNGMPDIADQTSFDRFVSLLGYVSERYKNVLKAVVPCAELDSESVSLAAGSDDRAVRYAAALARTASAVLSPLGVNTLLPLSAERGAGFLRMLDMEGLDDTPFGFVLTGDYSPKAVSELLSSSLLYKSSERELIYKTKLPDGEEALMKSFYSLTEYCSGVWYEGEFEEEAIAEFFRAADSADGVERADLILGENGGLTAKQLYPHVSGYKKVYKKTDMGQDKPEGSVSVLFDGKTDERWATYDACREVYQGAVNNGQAAELAFDFSHGKRGKAVFTPEPAADNGAFYIRLYADYLPADTGSISIAVYIYGDNGCVYGDIVCGESESRSVCVKTDGLLGTVRKIAFEVKQNGEGALSTPRICVSEIYAADARSEQTVTDEPETEPPEPETQIFETEKKTEPADTVETEAEDGSGKLLIITISVMLGMFALCGGVIFVLKKISEKRA